jgi:hypothetical protein
VRHSLAVEEADDRRDEPFGSGVHRRVALAVTCTIRRLLGTVV